MSPSFEQQKWKFLNFLNFRRIPHFLSLAEVHFFVCGNGFISHQCSLGCYANSCFPFGLSFDVSICLRWGQGSASFSLKLHSHTIFVGLPVQKKKTCTQAGTGSLLSKLKDFLCAILAHSRSWFLCGVTNIWLHLGLPKLHEFKHTVIKKKGNKGVWNLCLDQMWHVGEHQSSLRNIQINILPGPGPKRRQHHGYVKGCKAV